VYNICEESYRTCEASSSFCQNRYALCKVNADQPFNGPKDDLLLKDLSQCSTSAKNGVQNCLAEALENARQRYMKSMLDAESRSEEEVPPEDIEQFNTALSSNFTVCVTDYSKCLDYRGDQGYCTQKFHECSLGILSDAKLNDKTVQSFVYDPSKNQGLENEEHELSQDLFDCIQKYMSCTMNVGKSCMRDYNECTLAVLDDYHQQKSEENLINREGTEEDAVLPPTEITSEKPVIDSCQGISGAQKAFGSFTGKPASNTADCTWDFFTCTNNFGTWPENKECCEKRFDGCCEKVNGPKIKETSRPTSSSKPSDSGEGLQLIDCIWKYMACARSTSTDAECKSAFNQCSMGPLIAGGDAAANTPVTGLGQPGAGALKPDAILEIESVNEMRDDSEFLQCIKRLYNCQNAGITKQNCQNVELCVQPVEAEEDDDGSRLPEEPISGEYLPSSDSQDSSLGSSNFGGLRPPFNPVNTRPTATSTFTTTQTTQAVSKPTNPQCIWAYFGCGARHSESVCKQRFDDCISGNSFDYKICKGVDDDPQAYLVPHPEDCTKFYSCQNLGWRGGYIAHLMDCPPTTGFDTKLRICNYIRALPRCNKEQERKLFREVEGLIARQTRIKKQILDVPQVIQTKFRPVTQKPLALQVQRSADNATASANGLTFNWASMLVMHCILLLETLRLF